MKPPTSRFNVKVIEPSEEDDTHLQRKQSKSKFSINPSNEGKFEPLSIGAHYSDRPSFGADNTYYRKLRGGRP